MKKDTTSTKTSKIDNDLLKTIQIRLTHLEDMAMDNREVLIKLVKQGNQIVKFLQSLEVSPEEINSVDSFNVSLSDENEPSKEATENILSLLEQLEQDDEELKEFEKEIKKHLDKIVPGQVGES
tara:strand:+ start:297 stop:668 length:372 start_codon:yes stop_codon:yes gene_type:complete